MDLLIKTVFLRYRYFITFVVHIPQHLYIIFLGKYILFNNYKLKKPASLLEYTVKIICKIEFFTNFYQIVYLFDLSPMEGNK